MYRRTKTKSGHKLLRSPLTKLLVFYLVFATLLPALHLGFAKHSHRYDLATKQFLDIVNIFPNELDEDELEQSTTDPSLTRPQANQLKIYRCAVSNGLILSSIQIDLNGSAISAFNEKSTQDFSIENEYRPQKAFRIAPKQSPPAYA